MTQPIHKSLIQILVLSAISFAVLVALLFGFRPSSLDLTQAIIRIAVIVIMAAVMAGLFAWRVERAWTFRSIAGFYFLGLACAGVLSFSGRGL